jgi:hypothetical protein
MKAWSATLGLGDLDYGPEIVKFTPDSGATPIEIRWVESRTGQGTPWPSAAADFAEWERWLTFTDRRGVMVSFRRDGAPPGAA